MIGQTPTAASQQYVTFFIAGEEYVVEISRVREIIEYSAITRVPKTPKFIRGVINLRGTVLPVIDLAVKFGMPQREIVRSTCIVVLEVAHNQELTAMGLIADLVSQVIDINPSDIEKVPAFGTTARTEYLTGMVMLGKKYGLLLDVDRVLSLEEMEQVSAAETAGTKQLDGRSGSKREAGDGSDKLGVH